MKIVVNSKLNKRVERYIVNVIKDGRKESRVIEIAPKSNVTFTKEVADAFLKDSGALEALKLNHSVVISDSFMEKVETPVKTPVKRAVSTEPTAKDIVAEMKKVRSLEELEKFKDSTFASVKREYSRIEKKLK